MKSENILSNYFYSKERAKHYSSDYPDENIYKEYFNNLKFGCNRKQTPVSVLEVGCGTGRYFLL